MTAINDGAAAATFDDVVRLEVAERVLGGADDSPANRHGLSLARRTRYLLNRVNGTVQQAIWTTTVITASSATAYTVPATGVVAALLSGVGPGGGGAYTTGGVGHYSPGGGEGARILDYPIALTPGTVMGATIGVVGAGGTSGAPDGTAGGTSIFGGITLPGGGGASSTTTVCPAGGAVTVDGVLYRSAPGGVSTTNGGCGGGVGGGRGGSSSTPNGEPGENGGGGGGGGNFGGGGGDGGNGGPSYFVLKVLTLQPIYTA